MDQAAVEALKSHWPEVGQIDRKMKWQNKNEVSVLAWNVVAFFLSFLIGITISSTLGVFMGWSVKTNASLTVPITAALFYGVQRKQLPPAPNEAS
jgi:hypothetical protein